MMKTNSAKKNSYYFVCFVAVLFEAILTVGWFLLIPTDLKNEFLFGYSLARLGLLLFQVMVSVFCVWVTWKLWQDSSYRDAVMARLNSNERAYAIFHTLSVTIFLITSSIVLCPLYAWGDYAAYGERLRPLITFLMMVGIHGHLTLLQFKEKLNWKNLTTNFKKSKPIFIAGIKIFVVLLGIWGVISQTGIGIERGLPLWNEVGAPILAWQIWTVLWVTKAAGRFATLVKRKGVSSKFWRFVSAKKDSLLSIALFLLAFVLWSSVPKANQYFSPGPYPPDYMSYPYADAARFDIQAQFALIGQGFANGNIGSDHIGYAGFLAILHLIAGQDFTKIVTLQMLIYALFSVILYFLGKMLKDRATGLFFAALNVVHQYNSIVGGTTINTSHAANLLTEFPTGMLLAALALLLFRWLREPKSGNGAYALPVGGMLALLILVRVNTLLIPFLVCIVIIAVFGKDWRRWVTSILLVTLSMSMVLAPIMIVHGQRTGNYFFFLEKPKWYFNEVFSYIDETHDEIHEQTHMAKVIEADSVAILSIANDPIDRIEYGRGEGLEGTATEVASYFMHNVVTSVLILPNSPIFHNFQHVVFQNLPYWDKLGEVWNGEMAVPEMIGLALNLLILSVGMGAAWKKWKWAGLIPVGIFITYNFSTAMAGTAGGRYITATIWVILLYYGMGIGQILDIFSFDRKVDTDRTRETSRNSFSFRRGLTFLLPFLLFVICIISIDSVVPQRYPTVSKDEILGIIKEEELLSDSSVDLKELESFLKDSGSKAYWGLGLNPRYYLSGQGEHSYGLDAYQMKDYARLAFTIIGPFGTQQGILPYEDVPAFFPNATDLIVVGCEHKEAEYSTTYIDAVLIILFDEAGNAVVYVQEPWMELDCGSIEEFYSPDQDIQAVLGFEIF